MRRLAPLASVIALFGVAAAVEPIPRPPPEARATSPALVAPAIDAESDAPSRRPDAREITMEPSASGPIEGRYGESGRGSWADALVLRSHDNAFAVKVGGRVQIDSTAYTAGPGPALPPDSGGLDPPLTGAVNMRRGRIRIEGRMYELYDWAAEYDFVNQMNAENVIDPTLQGVGPTTAVTDLWLQMRELPWLGIVRIGNQKDPFGYEHLVTSRWLNFMERSFSQDAFEGPFNEGFVPGIQMLDASADWPLAWYAGQFVNTANPFGYTNAAGGSMTVGRLVYLPVFEDEGRQLVHLGIAGRTMQPQPLRLGFDPATLQQQGPAVPAARFRSRGDLRNGPPGPLNSIYADTGLLLGSWQNMLGLEFVGNDGPWSWQAEYFGSWLYGARTPSLTRDGFQNAPATSGRQPAPGTALGTVYYQGGYAEVLYFLTGESRTYSRLESRVDRPIPRANFPGRPGGGFGPGAWQVGIRYNYLCLDDGEVNGGVLNGVTLGLNWLLTPNARVYFNYDYTHRQFVNMFGDDGSVGIHGFGTRLAFDF